VSERKPELRLVSAEAADVGPNATVELIEAARRSLIEARTLPDIRSVMEMAAVAEDAARRVAKLAEAQRRAAEVVEAANEAANDAAAVRIEAKAKAGELLRQMADRGERKVRGDAMSQPVTSLNDLGVGRMEASRWQQVADVPEADREAYVEETKAAKGEVTTAGLLRQAKDDEQAGRVEANPSAGWDSPTVRRQRDLYRAMVSLATFPPALVGDLDGEESERRFAQAGRRLRTWLGELLAELRRVQHADPANDFKRIEAAYSLIYELRGLCGDPAAIKQDALVDAVGADERPELLRTVRGIAGWLAELEGELIRFGAGEQLDVDEDSEVES
jgi:hypothetical protein